MSDTTMNIRLDNSSTSRRVRDAVWRDTEKTIVYENSDHYVLALPNGAFEVYRNTSTHAVRVAQIGYKGQKGLLRAIAEADKRAA